MNPEEMLIEIEEQAEKVESVEDSISQDIITDFMFQDFYKIPPDPILLEEDGSQYEVEILFGIKENAYYKKSNEHWARLTMPKIPEMKKKVVNIVESTSMEVLTKRVRAIESQISTLDKNMSDGFEQIKNYIDLIVEKEHGR